MAYYSQIEIPFFGFVMGRQATSEERRMVFNPRKPRSGEFTPNTTAVEIGGNMYAINAEAQRKIRDCGGKTHPLYPGDIRAAWKAECEKYNTQTPPDPRIPCRTLCSSNEGDFQVTEYRLPSGEGLVSWGSFGGGWSGGCVVEKYGVIGARNADPCANL